MSATVVYHRLLTLKFQEKTGAIKIRGSSKSSDIQEAIRGHFNIPDDTSLILENAEGCVVVPDHTLETGSYTVYLKPEQLKSLAPNPYTLYVYEHCPFCCRAVLIMGWKKIRYDTVVFGYGDFEGPSKLIGKKMAPILGYLEEKGESKGQPKYMGESLDIVKFIDEREGVSLLKPETKRADLEAWIKPLEQASGNLLKPRVRKVCPKDFATSADLEYHQKKISC